MVNCSVWVVVKWLGGGGGGGSSEPQGTCHTNPVFLGGGGNKPV